MGKRKRIKSETWRKGAKASASIYARALRVVGDRAEFTTGHPPEHPGAPPEWKQLPHAARGKNDAPYHPIINPNGANPDEFGGSDFA